MATAFACSPAGQVRQPADSSVDIVAGDVTAPDTLVSAVKDMTHLIFTAAVAVGPARERLVIATEYQGVLNTLTAARQAGFKSRFLYMTSIGGGEDEMRTSGLNYPK